MGTNMFGFSTQQQLGTSPNAQQLASAYAESVQTNPELHHPSFGKGTANDDQIRRDLESWTAGVLSCQRNQQLINMVVNTTQAFGPQSTSGVRPIPQDVQQALRIIVNNYQQYRQQLKQAA